MEDVGLAGDISSVVKSGAGFVAAAATVGNRFAKPGVNAVPSEAVAGLDRVHAYGFMVGFRPAVADEDDVDE